VDKITIETWVSGNGKDYVADFLSEISPKANKKIRKIFEFIQANGRTNAIPSDILKKLKGCELYEIRCDWDKIAYRILGRFKGPKLILYHGFIKKQQNTPLRELNTTLNRAKEDG
jgi:phage-related protein